ncbi:RNA polymerase sigma factor [Lignipirellula cremea]|uniref:RNA polymerase sigma factor n=1 Tax=Lignipirellula cremea TaxID=2528010 RepID=A0A518DTM2_9BACT|nr:sigma-70 family RNA polymerase sigma factor [Lignipirellula cremea]QDU95158.1 RNA polymerase sigma factor [Lignipirellula cremea]
MASTDARSSSQQRHKAVMTNNPQAPEPQQHGTSAELFTRYQAGDQLAAEAIFQRYLERLTRLARSRLSPKLASRTDPEDVVLSAWRSFFLGARSGTFALRRSGDLWRLLASITLNKVYRQVRRHTAERRSIGREERLDLRQEFSPAVDQEPGPAEALALAEELEALMGGLDALGRRVLELRLQGETLAAIAADTGRSERTVRRTVAQLRVRLAQRRDAEFDD